MKLRLLITYIIITIATKLPAQQAYFDILSTENGLPNSSVRAIIRDHVGYYWIGTKKGLCRYNGHTFTSFRDEKRLTSPFNDDYIVSLFQASDNAIYIGTYSGGLYYYNYNTGVFTRLQFPRGIEIKYNNQPITSIAEDDAHRIWIATHGAGLLCYSPQSRQIKQIIHDVAYPHTPSSDNISSLAMDVDGYLWLATSGNYLDRLNTQTMKFRHFKHTTNIKESLISFGKSLLLTDSVLWLGTETNGLYAFNKTTQKFSNYTTENAGFSSNFVNSLARVDDKTLAIGTDGGGLMLFNLLTLQTITYKNDPYNSHSLSSHSIWSLFSEGDGNLWMGTFAGGINVFDRSKNMFHTVQYNGHVDYTPSNKSILSICEDSKGDIWLGTDGGGLNKYNHKTGTFSYFNKKSGTSPDVVKVIYEDKEHNLWLGSYADGLQLFGKSAEKYQKLIRALQGKSIWSMIEDNRENLWIGTLFNGLYCYNKKTQTIIQYVYDEHNQESISNNIINALLIDRSGRLWIGTDGGGLCQYIYSNQSFVRYNKDSRQPASLPDNVVRSIFCDKEGALWVGTKSGGLCKLVSETNKTFVNYTVMDDFPSNTISDIQQDDDGNLWISTDNGLCRFNTETKQLVIFDRDDGIQGNEFNYRASIQTHKGTLYFGGVNGFTYFEPLSIRINSRRPQCLLDELLILNRPLYPNNQNNTLPILKKPICLTDSLSITYDQKIITIELCSPDNVASDKLRFSYMLKGYDKQWTTVPCSKRFATYTGLKKGTFTFCVKAQNRYGLWSVIKELTITVIPPFWDTLWFKISILILAILLISCGFIVVIIFDKRQQRILERKVIERTQIIEEQKEEMRVQYDELLIIHEELKQQRTALVESREQVNQQNEELKTQSELLQEINVEIIDQSKKIEDQSKILRHKNDLLTRSLNYAQRIQNALFPNLEIVRRLMPKTTLFFCPKEIVSGDFYWVRKIDDFVVFAEVDCTGHGVPGAFMSMIGNTLLNEIVANQKLLNPPDVCQRLNEELLKIFTQTEFDIEAQDDGMDLTFCVYELSTRTLRVSAAMQNFYICKDGDVQVYKGDIFSIGGLMAKYKKPVYTAYEFNPEPGTRIFLSSDGFIDQFSGDRREKFGVERFVQLLIHTSTLPIENQMKAISDQFEYWKDGKDQLDDVLIMGIEF